MIMSKYCGGSSWNFLAAAVLAIGLGAAVRADVPGTATDLHTHGADAASDWATFHGPKRDNLSPDRGLLKQWPKGGPPLAWKATGLGDGYATIAIAGGRLFTVGAQREQAAVIAMDANGKKLWTGK